MYNKFVKLLLFVDNKFFFSYKKEKYEGYFDALILSQIIILSALFILSLLLRKIGLELIFEHYPFFCKLILFCMGTFAIIGGFLLKSSSYAIESKRNLMLYLFIPLLFIFITIDWSVWGLLLSMLIILYTAYLTIFDTLGVETFFKYRFGLIIPVTILILYCVACYLFNDISFNVSSVVGFFLLLHIMVVLLKSIILYEAIKDESPDDDKMIIIMRKGLLEHPIACGAEQSILFFTDILLFLGEIMNDYATEK